MTAAERLQAVASLHQDGEGHGGHESKEPFETAEGGRRELICPRTDNGRTYRKHEPGRINMFSSASKAWTSWTSLANLGKLIVVSPPHIKYFPRVVGSAPASGRKIGKGTTHHRALREERLEARDSRQSVKELLSNERELVHRFREESLGRVGEEGGEGTLHCRVGALDAERPAAEAITNSGEDAQRVVDDNPSELSG